MEVNSSHFWIRWFTSLTHGSPSFKGKLGNCKELLLGPRAFDTLRDEFLEDSWNHYVVRLSNGQRRKLMAEKYTRSNIPKHYVSYR